MKTRTLKLITWDRLDDWLRLGWLVVDTLPMPHARWSCLGEWLCDCPVRMVKR